MKRLSLVSFGERLIVAADTMRSKVDGIAHIVTVGLFVSLLVGGIVSMVHGQAGVETSIGAIESYQEEQDKAQAMTGATGASNLTFDGTSDLSNGLNGAGLLIGVEAFGEEAMGRADALGLSNTAKYGLLGVVDGEVTAMLVNPPGVNIPEHLANQWVPGHKAVSDTRIYAQSEGFDFLRNSIGLEGIWEMFRNLAYAGFVIVIMVAGIMIMFRSKLGGQTTVNLMNTIPGILVGLVVVTFSFAIVGFILDIGRLLTMIIGSYMDSQLGANGFQTVGLSGPLEMAKYAFTATNPFSGGQLVAAGLGAGFLYLIFAPIGIVTGLLMILVIVVIAAIALYAAIRVYATLLLTWIRIFVEVILGPLYILMGSLPGKSTIITDWIKRVMAGTLTFPVIFLLLNLGRYIGTSNISTGFAGPISFLSGGQPVSSIIEIRGIFVIATYFVAAGAPGIVNDLLAVTESKGVAAAIEGAKKAAGKIPLVGGAMG